VGACLQAIGFGFLSGADRLQGKLLQTSRRTALVGAYLQAIGFGLIPAQSLASKLPQKQQTTPPL